MLREAAADFKVALAFLTRFRIGRHEAQGADALAASAPWFPVIGALVGLAGAVVYALAFVAGLTSFLAAVFAVATLALVTGGLHEDGLSDVADGFGGGRARDDVLSIMRDPRLGTFGALALILALLARIGALATLALPGVVLPAMVAAGAVSRAVLPPAMGALPSARPDGLGAAAGRPHAARATAAAVVAAAFALLVLPVQVAVGGLIVAIAAAAAVAQLARSRIGGLTGDVLGAMQQAAEIGFLLGVVAFRL